MSGISSQACRSLRLSAMRQMLRRNLPPRLDARGWQNATLLGLLLVVEFAGILVTPLGRRDYDSFQGRATFAAMGSCLAPPTLLALWAVFGSGRLALRLPLTMWLAAAFYVVIVFALTRKIESTPAETSIALTCWLLAFVCAQAPLWLLRGLRRWRFVPAAAIDTAVLAGGAARANQFTLRGLLGWMLAATVLLAALRAIVPATSFDEKTLLGILPFVVFGGLVVALAGLPIVPLAWIFLAAGRRPVLRLVLSLLLLAGLPGGAWLFVDRFGGPTPAELIPILAGTLAIRPNVTVEYGASDRLLAQRLQTQGRLVGPAGGGVSYAIAVHPRPLKRLHAHGKRLLAGRVVTVTDGGLTALARLTELEELDLHGTAITDLGLPALSKLTTLRTLDLRGTEVTEQGIANLVRLLPDCQVLQ